MAQGKEAAYLAAVITLPEMPELGNSPFKVGNFLSFRNS